MSPLMAYRSDEEDQEFLRARDREVARIKRGRRHRWPLWKQCVVYSVFPSLLLLGLGEVCLAVRGPMHLHAPASEPHVTQVTSTPNGEHHG